MSTQKLSYKSSFLTRRLTPKWHPSTSPQYSESFLSRIETDSSIQSNDRFDSSSNLTLEYRQRNQLSYLLSLDFVQSSPSFIYPNLRTISSGYHHQEKQTIYMFSNNLPMSNNQIPLVFLGSEYFLRKSIDFQQLKYPLSTSEHLEPLVDLCLNRPQFLREIPQLESLSHTRFLPQTISGLVFFDSSSTSSLRHICSELNSKEHENKFTIDDLSRLSQRENHIIQHNALNDQRYLTLKNVLSAIHSYQEPLSSNLTVQPSTTNSVLPSMSSSYSLRNLPSIVTSTSS